MTISQQEEGISIQESELGSNNVHNDKPENMYSQLVSIVLRIMQANTGMLLFTAAEAFYALMSMSAKMLGQIDPPVSILEVIWIRMIITWACCVTYMLVMKIPDPFLGPKGIRLLLLFRGFCGFVGLFSLYWALQYLSLSDAVVLTFLVPLCTAVAGAVFLKEEFTWKHAFAGLCSLFGVILIARPRFLFGPSMQDAPLKNDSIEPHIRDMIVTPSQRLAAVGVSLIGVCGTTGAYTSIRAMGSRAHSLHNLVAFSSLCIIVTSIAIPLTHTEIVVPNERQWVGLLLLVGFFGFFAQILTTMGLKRETAGRATMALYTQIIFASILERIFFHTLPSLMSILGTVIILGSAVYVAISKVSSQSEKRIVVSDEDSPLEEGLLENAQES